MCLLNRCIFELNEIVADMFHGCHLIYPGKFGEIWDSKAWRELHDIIPGWVWALVRDNLSFRLKTKLALHHCSYSIDKLISIHASDFLCRLLLILSLRALYLNLLTLSQRLLSLNLRLLELLHIITIRILIPKLWHKLICAGIRNQVISFWIADLSTMSCISLQSTIEVVRINILDDPLH